MVTKHSYRMRDGVAAILGRIVPISNVRFSAFLASSILLFGYSLYGQTQREYIYLNGKLVAVEQSCAYSLSPTGADMPAGGGTGAISVTAGSGCGWTATSNDGWITITGGGSGSGNGTVSYSVAANTGPARNGTMTIAGQTFAVSQANGCTYSISPTSNSFGAGGGNGTVSVTAGSGCGWTATSNDGWITITGGGSGSGSGTVSYSVSVNPGPDRSGSITIGGQTFGVYQYQTYCGDGVCTGGEACYTCQADCGGCSYNCDQYCLYYCLIFGNPPEICVQACCH